MDRQPLRRDRTEPGHIRPVRDPVLLLPVLDLTPDADQARKSEFNPLQPQISAVRTPSWMEILRKKSRSQWSESPPLTSEDTLTSPIRGTRSRWILLSAASELEARYLQAQRDPETRLTRFHPHEPVGRRHLTSRKTLRSRTNTKTSRTTAEGNFNDSKLRPSIPADAHGLESRVSSVVGHSVASRIRTGSYVWALQSPSCRLSCVV